MASLRFPLTLLLSLVLMANGQSFWETLGGNKELDKPKGWRESPWMATNTTTPAYDPNTSTPGSTISLEAQTQPSESKRNKTLRSSQTQQKMAKNAIFEPIVHSSGLKLPVKYQPAGKHPQGDLIVLRAPVNPEIPSQPVSSGSKFSYSAANEAQNAAGTDGIPISFELGQAVIDSPPIDTKGVLVDSNYFPAETSTKSYNLLMETVNMPDTVPVVDSYSIHTQSINDETANIEIVLGNGTITNVQDGNFTLDTTTEGHESKTSALQIGQETVAQKETNIFDTTGKNTVVFTKSASYEPDIKETAIVSGTTSGIVAAMDSIQNETFILSDISPAETNTSDPNTATISEKQIGIELLQPEVASAVVDQTTHTSIESKYGEQINNTLAHLVGGDQTNINEVVRADNTGIYNAINEEYANVTHESEVAIILSTDGEIPKNVTYTDKQLLDASVSTSQNHSAIEGLDGFIDLAVSMPPKTVDTAVADTIVSKTSLDTNQNVIKDSMQTESHPLAIDVKSEIVLQDAHLKSSETANRTEKNVITPLEPSVHTETVVVEGGLLASHETPTSTTETPVVDETHVQTETISVDSGPQIPIETSTHTETVSVNIGLQVPFETSTQTLTALVDSYPQNPLELPVQNETVVIDGGLEIPTQTETVVVERGLQAPLESPMQNETVVPDGGPQIPFETPIQTENVIVDRGLKKPVKTLVRTETVLVGGDLEGTIETPKETKTDIVEGGLQTLPETQLQTKTVVVDGGLQTPFEHQTETKNPAVEGGLQTLPETQVQSESVVIVDGGYQTPIETPVKPEIIVVEGGLNTFHETPTQTESIVVDGGLPPGETPTQTESSLVVDGGIHTTIQTSVQTENVVVDGGFRSTPESPTTDHLYTTVSQPKPVDLDLVSTMQPNDFSADMVSQSPDINKVSGPDYGVVAESKLDSVLTQSSPGTGGVAIGQQELGELGLPIKYDKETTVDTMISGSSQFKDQQTIKTTKDKQQAATTETPQAVGIIVDLYTHENFETIPPAISRDINARGFVEPDNTVTTAATESNPVSIPIVSNMTTSNVDLNKYTALPTDPTETVDAGGLIIDFGSYIDHQSQLQSQDRTTEYKPILSQETPSSKIVEKITLPSLIQGSFTAITATEPTKEIVTTGTTEPITTTIKSKTSTMELPTTSVELTSTTSETTTTIPTTTTTKTTTTTTELTTTTTEQITTTPEPTTTTPKPTTTTTKPTTTTTESTTKTEPITTTEATTTTKPSTTTMASTTKTEIIINKKSKTESSVELSQTLPLGPDQSSIKKIETIEISKDQLNKIQDHKNMVRKEDLKDNILDPAAGPYKINYKDGGWEKSKSIAEGKVKTINQQENPDILDPQQETFKINYKDGGWEKPKKQTTSDGNVDLLTDNVARNADMYPPTEEIKKSETTGFVGERRQQYGGRFGLPLESLCVNSAFIDGIGYAEYPGHCNKLIQCYQYRGSVVAVERECMAGYFWHQDQVLCSPPAEVPCFDDPCLDIEVTSYNRSGGCRSFFSCEYGISMPMCCDEGFRYNGKMCVPDPTCMEPCLTPYSLENRLRYRSCKFLPDEHNPYGYITLEHNGLRIRACPGGTVFSARQCGCRWMGKGGPHPRRRIQADCSPDFYMNFNYGFKELSGSNMAFDVNNVVISDGAAQFNGKGKITLWGYMNKELGKKFAIRLRFKPDATATKSGSLISNCGMTGSPTVEIGLDNHQLRSSAKSMSFSNPLVIKDHFDPYNWNDVTYLYDGNNFFVTTNGYKHRKPLGGLLETRSNAIVIGGCPRPGSGFTGQIDYVELYSNCIPRNIFKPRSHQ